MFNIQWKIIIMGWKLQPNLQLVSPKNPMDVISAHGRIGRQTAFTWGKFVAMIQTLLKKPRLILPNSLWNWQSWRKTLQNVVGMPGKSPSATKFAVFIWAMQFSGDNGEILSLTLIASCPSSVNKYFFNFQTKFYSHQSNLLEPRAPYCPLTGFSMCQQYSGSVQTLLPSKRKPLCLPKLKNQLAQHGPQIREHWRNCLTNMWLRRRSVGVIQEHPCSWQ